MRRGVGVGALQQRQAMAARNAAMGEAVAADRARHVGEQLEAFRGHLARFAVAHRKDINADPEFRAAFARMTASCGVDPLASSKGVWGELLGLGDFYYELGVQVVDVCMATRRTNGGLLALGELVGRLTALRRGRDAISEEDVRVALRKLAVLGGGYRLVPLGPGGSPAVLSVPEELDGDAEAALAAAAAAQLPYVSVSALAAGGGGLPGWERRRAQQACDALLRDGLAWVDAGGGAEEEPRYYAPALWGAPL